MFRFALIALMLLVGFACEGQIDPTTQDDRANGTSGKADRFQDGGSNLDGTPAETDVETVNLFAPALEVDLHHVVFDEALEAPDYQRPNVDTGFGLGGTEFWQKWSGGHSPTFSYSQGSAYGKRCMYASALRFEAIMNDPPESILTLKTESNWGGGFFNWNDDYALSDWGDASSARLWAWRTGLIKWISQTKSDGSCYLPTREMVETLAADCLETAETDDGEIQGCRAP